MKINNYLILRSFFIHNEKPSWRGPPNSLLQKHFSPMLLLLAQHSNCLYLFNVRSTSESLSTWATSVDSEWHLMGSSSLSSIVISIGWMYLLYERLALHWNHSWRQTWEISDRSQKRSRCHFWLIVSSSVSSCFGESYEEIFWSCNRQWCQSL